MSHITSSSWEKTKQSIGNAPVENPIFVNCEQIQIEEFKHRFFTGFPDCEGWAVVSVLGPHNTSPSVPGWCINVLRVFDKSQHEHAAIFAKKSSDYLNVDLYIMPTGKFAPLPPPKGLPTSYADSVMDQHVNGYVNKENGDRKKLIDEAMKSSEENKKKIEESQKRQDLYHEKSFTEKQIDKNATERIDQPVKRSVCFENSSATEEKDVDM